MQTGIYGLQYSNNRDGNAGILVITADGKLAGGDPSFTYTGEWRQQGEDITAVLHVRLLLKNVTYYLYIFHLQPIITLPDISS